MKGIKAHNGGSTMRVRTTLSFPEDVWVAMRMEVEKRRLAGEKATLSGIIAKLLRAAIAGQGKKA